MNKSVYLGLQRLETNKIAMYEFWFKSIIRNQNTEKKQSHVTWKQIAS